MIKRFKLLKDIGTDNVQIKVIHLTLLHPRILFLGVGLIIGFISLHAQTTVVSSPYLVNTRADSYTWFINGQEIHPDSIPIQIFPHAEGFDTIVFHDMNSQYGADTILSLLPNDTATDLMFTIGCCDAGFDLHIIHQRQNSINIDSILNDGEAYYQYRISNRNYGTLQYHIKNLEKGDTLYAFYTDHSGFPKASIYFSDSLSKFHSPSLGGYGSDIYYFYIFRFNDDLIDTAEVYKRDSFIYWGNPDFSLFSDKLYSIQLKLFYHEKVRVTYDARTRKTTWEQIE